MRHLNAKLPFGTLVSYTLIGFTAVVLTGRPGEFVRPYLIAKKAKVPISTQIAAWVIERILDLSMWATGDLLPDLVYCVLVPYLGHAPALAASEAERSRAEA